MEDGTTAREDDKHGADWYRTLVEEVNDLATVVDTDGTITYVSPAVTRILGYEPNELIGHEGYEFVHPDDQERNAEAVETVLSNPAEPQTIEVRFQHADGSYRWIEATMRNRLEDGLINGILLSSRDITERKEHDHESGHELGHPETQIDVRMESDGDSNHFVPHVVQIKEEGAVRWVLESGAHDTVSYHPDNADLLPSATERRMPEEARPWRSELYRSKGETFERTFEEAGIYDYTCTVVEHGHGPDRGHGPDGRHRTHEATGMVGRVIVGSPELDSNAQPALQSPAGGLPDAARHEIERFNERTKAALEHPDEH